MDPTKIRWKVKEWTQNQLEQELNNLSYLNYDVRLITPRQDHVNDRLTFVVIACVYEGDIDS